MDSVFRLNCLFVTSNGSSHLLSQEVSLDEIRLTPSNKSALGGSAVGAAKGTLISSGIGLLRLWPPTYLQKQVGTFEMRS